jgi:hypothetical protein
MSQIQPTQDDRRTPLLSLAQPMACPTDQNRDEVFSCSEQFDLERHRAPTAPRRLHRHQAAILTRPLGPAHR